MYVWSRYLLICSAAFFCGAIFAQEGMKEENEFRNYSESCPEHVKKFYYLNHTKQTFDFANRKKQEYSSLHKGKKSIWEVIELLDCLVDESDPDVDLPQSYHAYQTAEALRKDGHPRWLILTGFIHDLGKMLAFYGEPQWAVVGDTFPLGCPFSDKIVFHEYFKENPDFFITEFQKETNGIYKEGCGFDNLVMSFGHDEYLYQVVKNYLPEEASYIIRYHSFYAAHRQGAYSQFMDDKDRAMIDWLKVFSHYDLYSKNNEPIDVQSLRGYYQDLVKEFFPEDVAW